MQQKEDQRRGCCRFRRESEAVSGSGVFLSSATGGCISLINKYRNIDDTTDVLSLGSNESAEKANRLEAPDNILRLGDIVVSYPQAIAEAAEENKMVDDKIIELVLHGLNHLLGIHHPE